MTVIVGVDPGFNGTGIATVDEATGLLTGTALVKPPSAQAAELGARLKRGAWEFETVGLPLGGHYTIEFPDRDDRKGEITDLFKLAALVGALTVRAPGDVAFVLPSEWKGNVPKDVHNDRVLAALTKKELEAFRRHGYGAADSHNVIDAIGIAKWRFNNPRFVSRLGTSQPLRQRIRKAMASGKF